MSDFCRQCNLEIFDVDESDFAGMITEEQFKAGWVAVGICEGCGGGEFDYEGYCTGRCINDHQSPNAILKGGIN